MANKKISEMTPITNSDNVKDDYILPIVLKEGDTLSNRSITVDVLRGAINKGGADYVELSSADGSKFRVRMNGDGEFVIYPIEAFEAPEPDPSASGTYNGLIINSMYGAGDKNANNTPASHHYIELYNNQPNGLDLNLKGLYLSVKGATGGWTSLALEGIIPYQHSFLVRCRQVSDPVLLGTRLKVNNYDMEWDVNLPEDGFSAYLSIGKPPTDSQGGNPWNHDGNNNKAIGYIDMLAAGGLTTDKKVQAYEYRYGQLMSKDIGIRRLDFCQSAADFAFKDQPENNQTAARALDFRTCDVETYRPRSLKDGKWDIYFDKLKLKENVPNLVNICYGKDGEKTRTFTYQTPVMDEGWVRYRLVNTNKWVTVETQREIVSHFDTEATIHRAIIRDLEPGEYEYQCGTEGMWSDIATFKVKTYGADDVMRILWTSDQQGWTTEQYQAWKVNYQNIVEQEPEGWDWHLNTGEISPYN